MNTHFKIGQEYYVLGYVQRVEKMMRLYPHGSHPARTICGHTTPNFSKTNLSVIRGLLEKNAKIVGNVKDFSEITNDSIPLVLIHMYSCNDYHILFTGRGNPTEKTMGIFMTRGDYNTFYTYPLVKEVFTAVPNRKREPKGYVYSAFDGSVIPLKTASRFLNTWINFNDENSAFSKINSKYILNSMSNVKDYISGETIDSNDTLGIVDTISINDDGYAKVTYKHTRHITDSAYKLLNKVSLLLPDSGQNILMADNATIDRFRHLLMFSKKSGLYYTKATESAQRTIGFTAFNNTVCPFTVDTEDKDLKAFVNSINVKYGTDSVTNIITEQKPYTFGVEIETSGGCVPLDEITSKHVNVKSVRDGSVSGGEYVTGVLKGDQGFANLKKLTNILSKNCTIDVNCGIHVHLGNFSFSKENILFTYILNTMLEYELMDMMPGSRRENRYCTALRKDLFNIQDIVNMCKPTVKLAEHKELIDTVYSKLYNYLLSNNVGVVGYSNSGISSRDDNPSLASIRANISSRRTSTPGSAKRSVRKRPHPGGHYGLGHNTARYNWLNIIPCNFRQKHNASLEFGGPYSSEVLGIVNYPNNKSLETYKLVENANIKAIKKSKMELNSRNLKYFKDNENCKYLPAQLLVFNEANLCHVNGSSPKIKKVTAAEEGGFTIEFRLHSATLNYTKISNWILICMGILSFVENKKQLLINAIEEGQTLTLDYVLSKTYSKERAGQLIDYINQRKRIFTAEANPSEESQQLKDSNSESILDIIKQTKNYQCV